MEDSNEVIEDLDYDTSEIDNNDDTTSNLESEENKASDNMSQENNEEENELDNMRKIKDENKKLINEVEALKERLLRVSAEYENYRKRTTKEKEGIYTEACTDVLKEMIPVLDTLERAINVDGNVDDFKTGMEMTIKGFKGSFEKLGVEEIDVTGGFDPNLHQAVMHIEDENFEANSVAEVFQKGYKRGDKVIRHTMVKVAN